MCTIDKMLIKGIRSFSPSNQGVIEFYKPLTLIVGHNGAGKTTIIECLKQACTGELPPNVKSGQSFIHDPKVAGESEVKAQIKLRIRTSVGQPVVIIRAFQLTQKKTALQFKALDQTLQTHDKDGNKQALSYRCADIDRIVPGLMGVSKAILECVIFVHQEDSNWPLADGQTLKRNFDDIFAATKYTKALEALRKLRTEKMQEAKELKLKLETTETLKSNADSLRGDKQDGETKARLLVSQISDITDQLKVHDEALKEKRGLLQRQDTLAEQSNKVQTQLDVLTQQNSEAYARMISKYGVEDLDGSIEELETWQAQHQASISDWQTELNRIAQEIKGLETLIHSLHSQYNRDMQQQASLKAAAEHHARSVAERDDYVREIAALCGISELAGTSELSTDDLSRFMAAFAARDQTVSKQLHQLKQNNQQLDDEASRQVDKATDEISSANGAVRSKQDQLQRNEARKAQLQSQARSCAVSSDMLEEVRERESKAKAALEAKQSRLAKLGADSKLQEYTTALRSVSSKLQSIRQERDRLLAQSEEATRARLKQQEVKQKEAAVKALMQQYSSRMSKLLGTNSDGLPAPDKVKEVLDSALESCQDAAEEAAAQLRQVQAKASGEAAVLVGARKRLAAQEQQLTDLSQQLQQGIVSALGQEEQPEALADCTNTCEKELADVHNRFSRVKATELQAEHYKKVAAKNHKCDTCGRPLQSEAEHRQLVALQDKLIGRMPAALDQLDEKINTFTERLNALKALQPSYLRHQTLQIQELPASRSHIQKLEASCAQLQGKVTQVQSACATSEQQLQEARSLSTDCAMDMDRLCREIADCKRALLAGAAAAAEGGRGIDDVDAELDEAEGERSRLELQREDLQRKQSRHKDDVAQAQTELLRVSQEVGSTKQQADKQYQLQQDMQVLDKHSAELQSEIQQLQISLQGLDASKRQLISEREVKRKDMRTHEAELETKARDLAGQRSLLDSKQKPIQHYIDSGGSERLEDTTQRLTTSKQRLHDKNTELQERQQKASGLHNNIQAQDQTGFQIEDTLAYKRNKAKEEQYAEQLQQLNVQRQQLGSYEQTTAEWRKLQSTMSNLQRDQDMKRGGLDTVYETVERANRALGRAEFIEIDAKCRTQLIELHTTELATGDLDKYHKALEKALLAFHTAKMADINKIIKELWQKTYRNQDIDYIQIKADADGARSYNYRVSMMAGGAELDMRGRCSAGQKVLACLIIRLALAETFCLNCGILALDEPTTNLDAANAASLAEALREIMESRRAQSNFQLVVITHDEQFAHMIGTREHAEYMWRMTKDDNQHSHISREDLSS